MITRCKTMKCSVFFFEKILPSFKKNDKNTRVRAVLFVKMFVENVKTMVTLHLTVLKSRRNSQGKLPVLIAVTSKRQVRYIKTGYVINDLFEFERGKVVCRKDAKIMNQRLAYVLSEYEAKLEAIPNVDIYTCGQLKDMLECSSKNGTNVFVKEYMEARIEELREEGRGSYADMNAYTLKLLLRAVGDLPLQSFTTATVQRFIKSMSRLSPATQQMRLTHLKARINEAVRDGVVKYEVHPFTGIRMPKPGVKLLDITVDEFRRIRNLDTAHKRVGLARDLFLLSFYLCGMNLADMVDADFSKDEVQFVRKKTQRKKSGINVVSFSIPLQARQIIDKYIKRNGRLDFGYGYSYRNFQRYLNFCMKKLAEAVGITSGFSFYSARKTFSQFAYDLGVRTEIIEYCIGQTMKENRPIYNYVRIMRKQADAAVRMVIGYTEHPEDYETVCDFPVQRGG